MFNRKFYYHTEFSLATIQLSHQQTPALGFQVSTLKHKAKKFFKPNSFELKKKKNNEDRKNLATKEKSEKTAAGKLHENLIHFSSPSFIAITLFNQEAPSTTFNFII